MLSSRCTIRKGRSSLLKKKNLTFFMLPIFRFKSETFTLSETVARSHLRPFFSPAEASRRSTSSVFQGFNSPLNLTARWRFGCVCRVEEGRAHLFPPDTLRQHPVSPVKTPRRHLNRFQHVQTAALIFLFFSPPSLVPSQNPLPYILCRRRKTTRSGKSILNEKMFRRGPPCGSVCPGEFVLCF